MKIDIITHIPDLIAFRREAMENAKNGALGFHIDKSDGVVYDVCKIPVHYNGTESLCLVRLVSQAEAEVFNNMSSCVRLGTCINKSYVFDSESEQLTYERVRGELKVEYKDENGETQHYFKPYMIGVIA